MGHRGISFSDVVPIFICLPSKGFWAFSASQCISFFCFVLQENSFYFSMAGNMKSFAEHAAQSWNFIFFQRRISSDLAYAPVTFCEQVIQRASCLLLPWLFVRQSSCLSCLVFGGQTFQFVKQKSIWNQEPLQRCAVADLVICKAAFSYIVCPECCV